MSRRRRGRRNRKAASGFLVITAALLYFAWAITYNTVVIICMIISGLATLVFGWLGRQETVATTKVAPAPKPTKVYRSRRQQAAQRRSEILRGKIVAGRTRMIGQAGCNSKCQNSRTPRAWCRCPCGGQAHGRARGIGIQVADAVAQVRAKKPKTRQRPRDRAIEPRSTARPIRYRARDGKVYEASATSRQLAELRRQGRLVEVIRRG